MPKNFVKGNAYKQALIAGLGNFVEFFDFALYGALTPIMAEEFFPRSGSYSQTFALAILFVGFLARPLGAWFFGEIADYYGRKPALLSSITLMAIATSLIGFLPSAHDIGASASVFLLFFRVLQGVSAGGEGYGSVMFALEHWPSSCHGRVSATMSALAVSGVLAATAIVAVVGSLVDLRHSWRYLFWIAGSVGFVSLLFRGMLSETQPYTAAKKKSQEGKQGLKAKLSFKPYWPSLMRATTISSCVGGLQLTLASYFTVFLCHQRQMPLVEASFVMTTTLAFYVPVLLVCGVWVDRKGARDILRYAMLALIVCGLPIFCAIVYGDMWLVRLAIALFAVMTAMATAAKGIVLYNFFPTLVRVRGASLAYALGTAVFGGGSPMINSALVTHLGTPMAPTLFVVFCATMGFLGSRLRVS